MSDGNTFPPHLAHFPGLIMRVGDEVRDAPEADQVVARSYPNWPEKGTIVRARRLTILTARKHVHPDQEVRIIHVAEAVNRSAELYTMGPKPVLGEYVDGKLATAPATGAGDPLQPLGLYDGAVVPGPVVDYGYDVSAYRFGAIGLHRIVWRLGDFVSNELLILVE
jgi:hypothetical protein